MPTRIDMIGIFVTDLQRMVAFYRDVLDFEIDWDGQGPFAEFQHEGIRFSMHERSSLPQLLGVAPAFPRELNGTFELAIDLPRFDEVDGEFRARRGGRRNPRLSAPGRTLGDALVDDRRPRRQPDRDRFLEPRRSRPGLTGLRPGRPTISNRGGAT